MTTKIKNIVKSAGNISLHDFLKISLNEFYSNGNQIFSDKNITSHYTTAPNMSKYFSCVLSNQLQKICKNNKNLNLIEFGCGNMNLFNDLSSNLINNNQNIKKSYLLDQNTCFDQIIDKPDIMSQSDPNIFLSDLDQSFDNQLEIGDASVNIVYSNEQLDVHPIHKYQFTKDSLQEQYINQNQSNNGLEMSKIKLNDDILSQSNKIEHRVLKYQIDDIRENQDEMDIEINTGCLKAVSNIVNLLKKHSESVPQILCFLDQGDNGFQRNSLTGIMNEAKVDWLQHAGQCDITYYVDWEKVLAITKSIFKSGKGDQKDIVDSIHFYPQRDWLKMNKVDWEYQDEVKRLTEAEIGYEMKVFTFHNLKCFE